MAFGQLRLIFDFYMTTAPKEADEEITPQDRANSVYAYIECFNMVPGARGSKMQLISVEKAMEGTPPRRAAVLVPLSAIRQTVLLVPHMESIKANLPPQDPAMSNADYRKMLLDLGLEAPLTSKNVMERCHKFVVCEGLTLTNFLTVYTGHGEKGLLHRQPTAKGKEREESEVVGQGGASGMKRKRK